MKPQASQQKSRALMEGGWKGEVGGWKGEEGGEEGETMKRSLAKIQ